MPVDETLTAGPSPEAENHLLTQDNLRLALRVHQLEEALRRIGDALNDPTLTEEEAGNVIEDLVQGVTKGDEAK